MISLRYQRCHDGSPGLPVSAGGRAGPTGIDRSVPGLAKAAEWARAEGLQVRVEEADLVGYRLSEPFDVVYGSGTVTYLPPHLRAAAFSNYKEWTRPGGVNAFNGGVPHRHAMAVVIARKPA